MIHVRAASSLSVRRRSSFLTYSSFLLKASDVSEVVFTEDEELSPDFVASLSFFLEDLSFFEFLEPDFLDLDFYFLPSSLEPDLGVSFFLSDLGNA